MLRFPIQIGDKLVVPCANTTGIPPQKVTVTGVKDFASWGSCTGEDGFTYSWTQRWIDEGELIKEEDMGIVFDSSEEDVVPTESVSLTVEPAWGQAELSYLGKLIDMAKLVPDRVVQKNMYDCINVRYRSKAYRDHIVDMESKGNISKEQLDSMRTILVGIRHLPRTPHAKAFRYQWP